MTMPSYREKEIMAFQIGRVNEQLKPFGLTVTTLGRADLADTLAKAARDYISGPLDDFGSGDRLRAALRAYEAATKGEPKQP